MKYYVSHLAFLAFFSIQTTAQKSSSEKEKYEVYAWALANVKDWDKLVHRQQAPKRPIFHKYGGIDTFFTYDHYTYDSIRLTMEIPPTDSSTYAQAMEKYKLDKIRWSQETLEGKQKYVHVRATDFDYFAKPSSEFYSLYKSVEIKPGFCNYNKIHIPHHFEYNKIDINKLHNLSFQTHKYTSGLKMQLERFRKASSLGLSEVFFNPSKTTAIFTFEESVYDNGWQKRISTFLLIKKGKKWQLATVLAQKEFSPY